VTPPDPVAEPLNDPVAEPVDGPGADPVVGVLLAAGGGRRMGGPKALLRDPGGRTFVDRAVGVLREGGCRQVLVVLGAAADEVAAALAEAGWTAGTGVDVVVAGEWATGMGASLRRGLSALATGAALSGGRPSDACAALVTLVDLPDVTAGVVARLLAAGTAPDTLARVAYDGVAGHPVLLGADHWAGVAATADGDRGARDYLAARPVTLVECGDLATGRDVDRPADLR
jgi:CTP:molybdopterin cytidylyltransferase MocA